MIHLNLILPLFNLPSRHTVSQKAKILCAFLVLPTWPSALSIVVDSWILFYCLVSPLVPTGFNLVCWKTRDLVLLNSFVGSHNTAIAWFIVVGPLGQQNIRVPYQQQQIHVMAILFLYFVITNIIFFLWFRINKCYIKTCGWQPPRPHEIGRVCGTHGRLKNA